MRKGKTIKTAVVFASAALFVSVFSMTAHAQENGVAGISYTIDNFLAKGSNSSDDDNSARILSISEIISPYANLAASKAENYVNIRSGPSTDHEVVGKLYRGCFTEILEYLDGDWVKIKSGDVTGYIAANYLAIGSEAETMVDKYADKYATVTTPTLKVRREQSTESKILELIPEGETYVVVKEYDEWVEILYGTDDDTGKDLTGFVHKDYVSLDVEFKYAISIEEENRIKREQEEAQKKAEEAEEERRRQLAEEKARKAEEERRAAEEAARNEEKEEEQEEKPSNSSGSSGNVSSLQKEIIAYALKFVGNPYVWGGTSLTNGADCSGFVQSIYEDFGYTIPRVSRDQAKYAGRKVDISDRQPGDLIFFTDSSGTVNHVAMYIGNDKIVHAANSRQGIIVSKYNYRAIYRIRRIVD
ncbi:MAG: hypothetical protein K0S76_2038 [Herbinix sp.]|nr:hypothetical protein [Herbinix sp.]